MLRNIHVGVCLFLFISAPLFAQESPQAEIHAGYSYLNIDTNGLSSRQSANGWEAGGSLGFNRWVGVEGSLAGYYKTYSFDLSQVAPDIGVVNVSVHDYSYLFGPRINFHPAFVHVLVGGDHLTGSALGFSASQDSLAVALGGGLELKVSPHWAIRGSGDYVLTRHNIFGNQLQTFTQNNFRASVGVAYTIDFHPGERTPRERQSRNQSGAICVSGKTEAPLLGVEGCALSEGFLVSSVHGDSPARSAGIQAGDTLTEIDGRAIHDAKEIELAISSAPGHSFKVKYLIKGSWMAEHEVQKP